MVTRISRGNSRNCLQFLKQFHIHFQLHPMKERDKINIGNMNNIIGKIMDFINKIMDIINNNRDHQNLIKEERITINKLSMFKSILNKMLLYSKIYEHYEKSNTIFNSITLSNVAFSSFNHPLVVMVLPRVARDLHLNVKIIFTFFICWWSYLRYITHI